MRPDDRGRPHRPPPLAQQWGKAALVIRFLQTMTLPEIGALTMALWVFILGSMDLIAFRRACKRGARTAEIVHLWRERSDDNGPQQVA